MKAFFVILSVIIFILNLQHIMLAEDDEVGPDGKAFKEQIIFDAKYILNAPKRMEWPGYRTWTTVFAAAALMHSKKEHIREKIQENTTGSTHDISKAVKSLGNIGVIPSIAAAFCLYGLPSNNVKSKETAFMIIESFCYSGALALLGRYIFAEDRPNRGGEMHYFKTGGHGISGHAALASSIAGPLNRQYLQIEDLDSSSMKFMKYLGKTAVYGYPFLTGLSRLHDDKHYSWNVLLGFAIGYTIGELVADAHSKRPEVKDISINPFIDDREKGIIVSVQF